MNQTYYLFVDESGRFYTAAYGTPSRDEQGACVAGLLFPQGQLPPAQTRDTLRRALPEHAAFLHVAELNRCSAHLVWLQAHHESAGTAPPAYVERLICWLRGLNQTRITFRHYGNDRDESVSAALNEELRMAGEREPLRIGALVELDALLTTRAGQIRQRRSPSKSQRRFLRDLRSLENQVSEARAGIREAVQGLCLGNSASLVAATHLGERPPEPAPPYRDGYLLKLGCAMERACLRLRHAHSEAPSEVALVPQAAFREVTTNRGDRRPLTHGVVRWLITQIETHGIEIVTDDDELRVVAHMNEPSDPALHLADYVASRLRVTLRRPNALRWRLSDMNQSARSNVGMSLLDGEGVGLAAIGEPQEHLRAHLGTTQAIAVNAPSPWAAEQVNAWLELFSQ